MNQAIEGVRWTIHDLELLPENEWTRYEIIIRPNFETMVSFYTKMSPNFM